MDEELTAAERIGAIVDADEEVMEIEREIVAALRLAIADERKVNRLVDAVTFHYRTRIVAVAASVPA